MGSDGQRARMRRSCANLVNLGGTHNSQEVLRMKYIVTFTSGLTTIMDAKELIAKKAWLLSIGAEWQRI